MLKILWSMLEFDEWQHQNHVSLQTVKVGHYTKKEKKKRERKKSPHCDLDHEDSKKIFLHDTLAHDDASPYYFRLQKFKCFGDTKWTLKNLHCEHSNIFTRHSSLMMVYHPSPKSLHWQFRRYDRNKSCFEYRSDLDNPDYDKECRGWGEYLMCMGKLLQI